MFLDGPRSALFPYTTLFRSPPGASSGYQAQLSIDVPEPDALSEGLFAITGVSSAGNTTFLFDNEGVGRGQLLSTDHPTHNLRVEEGRLVVATGSRQEIGRASCRERARGTRGSEEMRV